MEIVDSRLISLNSKDAQKLNGDYNSNCLFNIPNIVDNEDEVMYIEAGVEDAEIPISWWLINDTNDTLHYRYNSINSSITLTQGNYNATQLITELQQRWSDNGLTSTIVLNSVNGKLDFRFSSPITDITLYYNLSRLLMEILGFTETVSGTSFIGNRPLNLLGILKVNICSKALAPLNSYSSNSTLNNQIIQTVAVNQPSYHQLTYINKASHFNRLKSKTINNIDILLIDDNGNPLEMNNIDWGMSIQIKIYKKIKLMENLKISDNYRKIENEKTEEKNEKKKDEKKDEKEELTDLDILTS